MFATFARHAGARAATWDAVRRCAMPTCGRRRSVRAACLIVTGAHDLATPPAAGAWLAATIPGAQLVELDAAHISNIERAARFTRRNAARFSRDGVPPGEAGAYRAAEGGSIAASVSASRQSGSGTCL